MGRLSEARLAAIDLFINEYHEGSETYEVLVDMRAALRERDAELLRLRRIILEDSGGFTREQIEALLAPKGKAR